MNRMSRSVLVLGGALVLAPIVQPALAQSAPPPGSTINGTVPASEGNIWNGLDHQPTPSETAPINNPRRQAHVNHTLNKLDQQLLNDPLPKVPAGAPAATGN
jgi:hypothetical protein